MPNQPRDDNKETAMTTTQTVTYGSPEYTALTDALDAAREAHHKAREEADASARVLADYVLAGLDLEHAAEMYRKHRDEKDRLKAAWLDASDALRIATGRQSSVR